MVHKRKIAARKKIESVRRNISNWMERMSTESFSIFISWSILVGCIINSNWFFNLIFHALFFTVLLADELWDCGSDTSKVKVFFFARWVIADFRWFKHLFVRVRHEIREEMSAAFIWKNLKRFWDIRKLLWAHSITVLENWLNSVLKFGYDFLNFILKHE